MAKSLKHRQKIDMTDDSLAPKLDKTCRFLFNVYSLCKLTLLSNHKSIIF